MTSLRTVLSAQIDATFDNAIDLVTATAPLSIKNRMVWTNGTGTATADRVFSDTRTIAASGNEDLDLAGVLTSVYGTAITFVELRAIYIAAAAGNTNNVRLIRPASNGVPLFLAASDGIDIPPGGFFMWACPADGKVTVTAGTGDLLNVANSSSGTPVTYDVVIIGTSA